MELYCARMAFEGMRIYATEGFIITATVRNFGEHCSNGEIEKDKNYKKISISKLLQTFNI